MGQLKRKTVLPKPVRLMRELVRSGDCAVCGGTKTAPAAFCPSCLARVPKTDQAALKYPFRPTTVPVFWNWLARLREVPA